MKDPKDRNTLEILSNSKRRGRKPTGKAKTGAERMKAYRARKAELERQKEQQLAYSSNWETEKKRLLDQNTKLYLILAQYKERLELHGLDTSYQTPFD